MDKATAKKYAAYLEIIILLCIAGYILQSTLIKYLKRDYADQFSKHKDNPLSILFASQAGSSSNEVFKSPLRKSEPNSKVQRLRSPENVLSKQTTVPLRFHLGCKSHAQC